MDCITRVREPSSNSSQNQSIHDTCAGEIALQRMLTSQSQVAETGCRLLRLETVCRVWDVNRRGEGDRFVRGFKESKFEQ